MSTHNNQNQSKGFDIPDEPKVNESLDSLWDIKPIENREFISFAKTPVVEVKLPEDLKNNTVQIKGKYGTNVFLKVERLCEGKWTPAFLKVDSFTIRKAIYPFACKTIRIERTGTGFDTKYHAVELIE